METYRAQIQAALAADNVQPVGMQGVLVMGAGVGVEHLYPVGYEGVNLPPASIPSTPTHGAVDGTEEQQSQQQGSGGEGGASGGGGRGATRRSCEFCGGELSSPSGSPSAESNGDKGGDSEGDDSDGDESDADESEQELDEGADPD